MEKHFPPKRSFIKSLGHERDKENKIISCSTYYDRRQKTSLYYSAFRICIIFIYAIVDCKEKRRNCAHVSVITRIKTFSYIAVLCRGNQMEQTTRR